MRNGLMGLFHKNHCPEAYFELLLRSSAKKIEPTTGMAILFGRVHQETLMRVQA